VKAGAGIAVISQRAVQDDIRCGLLAGLRFQGTRLVRDVFLVTQPGPDLTPAGDAFAKFLVLPRHLSEEANVSQRWPGRGVTASVRASGQRHSMTESSFWLVDRRGHCAAGRAVITELIRRGLAGGFLRGGSSAWARAASHAILWRSRCWAS